MKEFSRRKDIDIAKGIGILLVVWAHANGPFSEYIVQFHMPFFFFVSGLLYRSESESGYEYILRKCKALLIPFWVWNIICYPVYFCLFYWGNWSASVCVKELFEILLTVGKVPFLGATWFLPSLFWVSILIHFWIGIFSQKTLYGDILLLLFGVVVALVGFNFSFPYRISRTLICMLFYICGYLYRKYLSFRISNSWKDIIACFGAVIFVLVARHNNVDMGQNIYASKYTFVLGAFAASVFVLRLSTWIANTSLLDSISNHFGHLGQNSIDIVIWHLLAFRIAILVQIIVLHLSFRSIVAFPIYDSSGLWWILYLISGIYGSLAWKYILKKFLGTFLLP